MLYYSDSDSTQLYYIKNYFLTENNNFEMDSQNHILSEIRIVYLHDNTQREEFMLKEGDTRYQFSFCKLCDNNGSLVYKGLLIDQKRFGYGESYHPNGSVEYRGYWCNDRRCGSGKLYDLNGKLEKECEWYNGVESNIKEYVGDGSQPIHTMIEDITLSDSCVLKEWDVSMFFNLKSITIGDDCFKDVITFKIDGLSRLENVKIGRNSFNKERDQHGCVHSKSFQIVNCESLEWLEIGEYSFSDFETGFKLCNLPSLQNIKIGTDHDSYNFYKCSFEIQGRLS